MRAVVVVVLLAIPLLVVAALPRVLEFAGSVPLIGGPPPAAAPTPFRLADPTPPTKRFAPVEEPPPPTLVPAATPTARPRAIATPTGERVIVTNTGGLGAVLRAEPVSGRQIASLREQLEVTLLERRQVEGTEWARVRTPDGQEGWVLGVVARPAPAPRP